VDGAIVDQLKLETKPSEFGPKDRGRQDVPSGRWLLSQIISCQESVVNASEK
jgi:hypothetical protein